MHSDDSDLVDAWLRFNLVQGSTNENDPDYWAVQALIEMQLADPERAWTVAVQLARRSETDWQLVMVGCGVLEDLLIEDPDRYFPKLEQEFRTTPTLLTAASCVWIDEPSRSRMDALLAAWGQARHP